METERNQRFFSLDRAIEQNQRLNPICRVRISPSSTLDPTRSLGMPLTANRVLALLEEIDELGEDS